MQNQPFNRNQKQKNFWQKLKAWQKTGIILFIFLLIYIVIVPLLFCVDIIDSNFAQNSKSISCSKNSDCVITSCGCLNKKTVLKCGALVIFSDLFSSCEPPSSCSCQNGQCVSDYDYGSEEFYKGTDEENIENVFNTFLEAEKNCDIASANSVLTEESREIMNYTCSNMAAEYKCYKDIDSDDYEIYRKNDKAILHFYSFSHKTGWPFFFAKESSKWKIDFHKMAFGIAMGGSGCATGWGWRNEEIVDEFCSYFKEGECPEK